MTSLLEYLCPKCQKSHGKDILYGNSIEAKYCCECIDTFPIHVHRWWPNGEVQDTYPPSYGFECVCGEKTMVTEQWK